MGNKKNRSLKNDSFYKEHYHLLLILKIQQIMVQTSKQSKSYDGLQHTVSFIQYSAIGPCVFNERFKVLRIA